MLHIRGNGVCVSAAASDGLETQHHASAVVSQICDLKNSLFTHCEVHKETPYLSCAWHALKSVTLRDTQVQKDVSLVFGTALDNSLVRGLDANRGTLCTLC